MLNAIFNYKGIETVIQCNKNEMMKEIINRYRTKEEIYPVYYLYNGGILNEELRIEKIINKEDNKNNKMKIILMI